MSDIKYKLVSLSIDRINELLNKIPDAPIQLRNFFITAGIQTREYNEYGADLYAALILIFKNKYDLVKESFKLKSINKYVCTFIIEENTNKLIGTMTMNDNVIGTITIFPDFRRKGIATNILSSILNTSNKLNMLINIYPNSELKSIVKKVGFIYSKTKEPIYAYNKYGERKQLDRYVSKEININSDYIVMNIQDYKEFFNLLGYTTHSAVDILGCCGLIDMSCTEKKDMFYKLFQTISNLNS